MYISMETVQWEQYSYKSKNSAWKHGYEWMTYPMLVTKCVPLGNVTKPKITRTKIVVTTLIDRYQGSYCVWTLAKKLSSPKIHNTLLIVDCTSYH